MLLLFAFYPDVDEYFSEPWEFFSLRDYSMRFLLLDDEFDLYEFAKNPAGYAYKMARFEAGVETYDTLMAQSIYLDFSESAEGLGGGFHLRRTRSDYFYLFGYFLFPYSHTVVNTMVPVSYRVGNICAGVRYRSLRYGYGEELGDVSFSGIDGGIGFISSRFEAGVSISEDGMGIEGLADMRRYRGGFIVKGGMVEGGLRGGIIIKEWENIPRKFTEAEVFFKEPVEKIKVGIKAFWINDVLWQYFPVYAESTDINTLGFAVGVKYTTPTLILLIEGEDINSEGSLPYVDDWKEEVFLLRAGIEYRVSSRLYLRGFYRFERVGEGVRDGFYGGVRLVFSHFYVHAGVSILEFLEGKITCAAVEAGRIP